MKNYAIKQVTGGREQRCPPSFLASLVIYHLLPSSELRRHFQCWPRLGVSPPGYDECWRWNDYLGESTWICNLMAVNRSTSVESRISNTSILWPDESGLRWDGLLNLCDEYFRFKLKKTESTQVYFVLCHLVTAQKSRNKSFILQGLRKKMTSSKPMNWKVKIWREKIRVALLMRKLNNSLLIIHNYISG